MTDEAKIPVRRGLMNELGYFFWKYKMWWLVPVVMVVLTLGVLVAVGGSQGIFLLYALF